MSKRCLRLVSQVLLKIPIQALIPRTGQQTPNARARATEEAHTTYTFTGLAEGTHTVDVRATDKAGNIKQETISFKVDTSHVLGLGYRELVVIITVVIIAVIGTSVYLLKTRKKS